MYCKYCGKYVDDNANFCDSCGGVMEPDRAAVQNNQYDQYNPAQAGYKSKVAAGVLGIVLGALGIHNFYLGYNGRAIAQLLITLLSCGFLSVVSWVWGLIEGIMILTGSINTDADGNPLSQ